jgi:hypothetical protein
MFNTTDGKKRDSDHYSFGGMSDADDRESIGSWQKLINQREELRLSIMSTNRPKVARLSSFKVPSGVSDGGSDGPGSPFTAH